MTTTVIEIIDTAVKVGLGALISGATSYWVAKSKFKNEYHKEKIAKHRELIEKSAEQIEEFSHVLMKYWALIIELVRNKNQGMSLTKDRKEELNNVKKELFIVFKELTSAESKLLLLGHNRPQKDLRNYGDLAKKFRREAWEGNESLTVEIMEEYRIQLLGLRNTLFVNINNVYNI